MELTAQNVENVFKACLFKENENIENSTIVDGITTKCSFNSKHIEENKSNIENMLAQLPDEFKKQNGGGWSFLNLCNNNKGEQWTGFHFRMEQLICLGMAIKKVKYLMPREMWNMLPGGMPYLVIEEIKEEL